ncbi:MAG: CTP synthase [bacterium]
MKKHKNHYIFITGGVISSLGKGIIAASLGSLLKKQEYSVTIQKFDPYLNIDPGTMNPYQHGEVFVTEDGTETDLDLGHYERFIDQNLSKKNNVTSGMIFWDVLNNERNGKYLGKTVQIIPHITNEIKNKISQTLSEDNFNFIITEIGGTVGDIESLPFLEAIRQFQYQNKTTCIHIHLTLLPFIKTSNEFKTKPTQHSVKELREIGIQPDIIICRCEKPFTQEIKSKIALFCDVKEKNIIAAIDAKSIYSLPLYMHKEGLDTAILDTLNLPKKKISLQDWEYFNSQLENKNNTTITIGIVGKYTNYSDSYISIVESLKHSSVHNNCNLKILWIDSEKITEKNITKLLAPCNGILIPGGFGERGIEGKVLTAKYAREQKIPFFGICLGLQIAIIEFARNILHIKNANSKEFNKTEKDNVITFLPEQKNLLKKGASMRLGAYTCQIKKDSLLFKAYQSTIISERHRHRYEFNNHYKTQFEDNGLIISGKNPNSQLVEVIELKNHPWFLACQFHPEFKSRPQKGSPLFNQFTQAAKTNRNEQKNRK